jgi:hypothetical protein
MRRNTPRHAPRNLGELIVAVDDQARRRSRGANDRRRLAALWVAVTLLGSGNRSALERLATAG